MQMIKTNGIHIHYRQRGSKDGTPLVFSNSLGTDFRVWDALIPHFSDKFSMLLYDKRGHGLSECPSASYHINDHVDDLSGLMQALDISNALVCGLSVGGLIAQGLSAAHPELVRGLILADTAHKIGLQQVWDDRIEVVRDKGISALQEPILERWFSEDFRTNHADELAGWCHMLVRTPRDGYVGTCVAIRDADMTTAAQNIKVPTLCLGGSEDGSTPPDLVKSMADLIPGAKFRIVDGAGHLPCVEKPEQMAEYMWSFIKEAGFDK